MSAGQPIDVAIRALPQAAHFVAADMDRMALFLSRLGAGEQALHLARLRGFAPNETGILVVEAEGGRDPGDTARGVVMEKLLRRLPPHGATPEAQARSLLERLAWRLLERKGAVRDAATAERIRVRGWDAQSAHPWLISETDGWIRAGRRHEQIGVAHCSVNASGDEVPYRMVCALHQHVVAAQLAGVTSTAPLMTVAQLRFPAAAVLAPLMLASPVIREAVSAHVVTTLDTDDAVASLEVQRVAWDADLAHRLCEIGDSVWSDGVLVGRLPRYPTPARGVVAGVSPETVNRLAHLAASLGRVAEHVLGERDAAYAELAQLLRHGEGTLDITPLSRASQTQVDWEAVGEELRRRGFEPSKYRAMDYDIAAIRDALLKQGIDPDSLARPGAVDPTSAAALIGADLAEFASEIEEFSLGRTGASQGALEAVEAFALNATAELVAVATERANDYAKTVIREVQTPAP